MSKFKPKKKTNKQPSSPKRLYGFTSELRSSFLSNSNFHRDPKKKNRSFRTANSRLNASQKRPPPSLSLAFPFLLSLSHPHHIYTQRHSHVVLRSTVHARWSLTAVRSPQKHQTNEYPRVVHVGQSPNPFHSRNTPLKAQASTALMRSGKPRPDLTVRWVCWRPRTSLSLRLRGG